MTTSDAIIVGGGIVGASTARELSRRGLRVFLVEKENQPGLHASGRNSGVLHSGIFNRPGTVRSKLTQASLPQVKRYCAHHRVPFAIIGKVIGAQNEQQAEILDLLSQNAKANGLVRPEVQEGSEVEKYEPHAIADSFLFVAESGIVDSQALVRSLIADAMQKGARVGTNARVGQVFCSRHGYNLQAGGVAHQAPLLVNAAGVHSDEVAWGLGVAENYVVIPFRGDYYRLANSARGRVRGLIYPIKDPELPFLGIHFTVTTSGETLVGPNAVISPGRETYRGLVPTGETFRMALEPGFLRMILKNKAVRKHAPRELLLSMSPRAFLHEAQSLVRGLRMSDLLRTRSGIRAQLVRREDGSLVDDFTMIQADNAVHILNAVSPTLTNSLAIGELVADAVTRNW